MTTTLPKKRAGKAPRRGGAYLDEYLGLCADLPLARIETKAEFARAGKIVDRLAVVGEERLSRAQSDYLDVLVTLFEDAEQRLFGKELAELDAALRDVSGVEALRYLAEQTGMSGSDLGRLLGNRQLGSAILRGDRQISKANAKRLGEHFRVDAGLFL